MLLIYDHYWVCLRVDGSAQNTRNKVISHYGGYLIFGYFGNIADDTLTNEVYSLIRLEGKDSFYHVLRLRAEVGHADFDLLILEIIYNELFVIPAESRVMVVFATCTNGLAIKR